MAATSKAPSLEELNLPRTLGADKGRLQNVDVPIVTTSASFRTDPRDHDIVFSRGHFSMSVALLEEARNQGLTSWFTDPINYVSRSDWERLKFVVLVGQLVARFPFLKKIKDQTDALTRGNLPITHAITKPLLYATADDNTPVISTHYETGNILAKEGRVVLQVVTDPHVRSQYLLEAGRKNICFAVFNEDTKKEFIKKAKEKEVDLEVERVVVTGPPVDPRIIRARTKKNTQNFKNRPLRLCVTTGGLGQNREEIENCLESIAEDVKSGRIQLILYASTLPSFREMYVDYSRRHTIPLGSNPADESGSVRIIYSSSVVEANQTLVDYAFSWADGFVTKPSGDMAYDAAAAGCFILALTPWGEWEENVQKIFSDLSILKEADMKNLSKQIDTLKKEGWIYAAINNALNLDKLFLTGAKNIVDLQQKLASRG
ncbi:MAG: hypothetical protein AAB599_03460 [Patescibacteria group bacterium]